MRITKCLNDDRTKRILDYQQRIRNLQEHIQVVQTLKDKIAKDHPEMDNLACEITAENLAQESMAQKLAAQKIFKEAQEISKKAQTPKKSFWSWEKTKEARAKVQSYLTKEDQPKVE